MMKGEPTDGADLPSISTSEPVSDRTSNPSSPQNGSIRRSLETAGKQSDKDEVGEDVAANANANTAAGPTERYSAFTKSQKIVIVIFATIGGAFSPFSANTYFPSLNTIADDLHVSLALINLTVTAYLIFQGIGPTFIGDFADTCGRRPAYFVAFTIYLAANLGMALSSSYAALVVLRCLQSAGSSGTISLATAAVADIADSSERGTYMSWAILGIMAGPSFGPVLGGLLSQNLGWHSIFWFLFICAVVFIIPFAIFCPETCRNIVGDGSIRPQAWNMSLINYLAVKKQRQSVLGKSASGESQDPAASQPLPRPRLRFPNPLHTLRIVTEPDVAALLLCIALIFLGTYDIMALNPQLFARIYGYDDFQIGLCFIPFGVGCLTAPVVSGRLMDWNWRREARRCGMPHMQKNNRRDNLIPPEFPLERARVTITAPHALLAIITFIANGWALAAEVHVAVVLIIQFFNGMAAVGVHNTLSVLLLDLHPGQPATATAANNIVRCLICAAGTSVAQFQLDGLGVGWCYTVTAAWCAASIGPIFWMLLTKGPKNREKRRQKALRKETATAPDEEQAKVSGGGQAGADEKDDARA